MITNGPMSPVARDVSTAAQLDAESGNRDDPDTIAVLLAEERHRAVTNRVLGAPHLGVHRRVAVDVLVDHALDFPRVVVGERLEVREVESEPVRRDERAGLTHVGAEPLPERRVEEVSGRVIAPRRVASARVNARRDPHAGRERGRDRDAMCRGRRQARGVTCR